ncbi:MAG TPA: hypothetical protein VGX76_10695, partial [Pirellulales bacterium]|nr:hypothetical protein [Pirellulales bacterium]
MPVPPPNYVPGFNDCMMAGCGCGCGGSSSGGAAAPSGCGGSCGGGTPALGMTSCSGDPGAKQLQAVNDLLHQATGTLLQTTTPGFMEVWDANSGDLLRQYAVPTVDGLAPTPVFTYNSLSGFAGEFG